MLRIVRILADTFLLCVVGAMLGGAAGAGSVVLLGLPGFVHAPSVSLLFLSGFGALLGGALGGPLGPLLGWFVLRGVSVKRAAWILPVGTLLGGFAALAVGWLVADVSDGKGTLYLSGGGIIGVVVTAIRLRSQSTARPADAKGVGRLGALIIP